MDSAFIHQAANELVQNAGTRNIKQIARSCSLDISETSRIKDMLGLLSLYFDKPLILINHQLDKQTKQMVCGYALGHYALHRKNGGRLPECYRSQSSLLPHRHQGS